MFHSCIVLNSARLLELAMDGVGKRGKTWTPCGNRVETVVETVVICNTFLWKPSAKEKNYLKYINLLSSGTVSTDFPTGATVSGTVSTRFPALGCNLQWTAWENMGCALTSAARVSVCTTCLMLKSTWPLPQHTTQRFVLNRTSPLPQLAAQPC